MHNLGGVNIVHKQDFHMGTCIEGGYKSKLGAPLFKFFDWIYVLCCGLVAEDERSGCQNDAYFWREVFCVGTWYCELVNWCSVGLSHLTLSRFRAVRTFIYLPDFHLIITAGTQCRDGWWWEPNVSNPTKKSFFLFRAQTFESDNACWL